MALIPSKIKKGDDLSSGLINKIIDCLRELYGRTNGDDPDPSGDGGGGGGGASAQTLPFTVSIVAGNVAVRTGHHVWWNSNTETIAVTTLSSSSLAVATAVTVVYLKRIYNADGTATATLETTATDYASIMAAVTNTEARWVLATLSGGVVVQQWWTGDISELRVA